MQKSQRNRRGHRCTSPRGSTEVYPAHPHNEISPIAHISRCVSAREKIKISREGAKEESQIRKKREWWRRKSGGRSSIARCGFIERSGRGCWRRSTRPFLLASSATEG